MQASGAKAVIVGDNQRGGLITMYARGKDLFIPNGRHPCFPNLFSLCSQNESGSC